MTELAKGDHVVTPDGTRATFVRYTGIANKGSAVIQVGLDTRVVASVSLRKVD
ncbi:hypothetical protein [Streptomyces sp. AC495_CC817]|uniref:hypothetical protein n=1 Tax=Streptomyces sp. AC495_CC817 TaxID=2823900 RepID=UPI001C263333|nr:hypothetical protein [Streptomyces sp. AC495_CC817]